MRTQASCFGLVLAAAAALACDRTGERSQKGEAPHSPSASTAIAQHVAPRSIADSDERVVNAAVAGRWATAMVLDTIWLHRGSFDDTVLSEPARLAARDDVLIVPDFDRGGYHVIDAASGDLTSFHGRRGQGPFEFERMTPFVLQGSVDSIAFGIVDERNRRVTYIDGAGVPRHMQTVPFSQQVLGACSLRDSIDIGTSRRVRAALGRFALAGDSLSFPSAPWRAHRDTLDTVTGQFHVTSLGDGWCALVPMLGPDALYLYGEGDVLRDTVAARESVPWSIAVRRPAGAGYRLSLPARVSYSWVGVARVDDVLVAAFAGTDSARGRHLDLYRWGSFEYLGSSRLPWRVREVASAGGRLFVLGRGDDGYFRLGAFRLRSSDAP